MLEFSSIKSSEAIYKYETVKRILYHKEASTVDIPEITLVMKSSDEKTFFLRIYPEPALTLEAANGKSAMKDGEPCEKWPNLMKEILDPQGSFLPMWNKTLVKEVDTSGASEASKVVSSKGKKLVKDGLVIAKKIWRSCILIDILSVLPLPQVREALNCSICCMEAADYDKNKEIVDQM
ncbi:unnamed protein product [Prunus armeniaca]